MITQIGKQLATQIVDTVHDVCGHDINFINRMVLSTPVPILPASALFMKSVKKLPIRKLSLKYRKMTTTKEPAAESIFLLHTTDISLLLSE